MEKKELVMQIAKDILVAALQQGMINPSARDIDGFLAKLGDHYEAFAKKIASTYGSIN